MSKTAIKQRQQRRAQQQRLVLLIGLGAVGVLVILFAIAQAVHPNASVDPTQVAALASGKTLGKADAPVLVEEFADFQCPICGQFHASIEPQLIADYVQTGKIAFEYHHFIVIDGNVGGTESRQAAEASECANTQGKFWIFHDTLFENQGGEGSGAFSDAKLLSFAGSVGLDTNAFQQCFGSHKYAGVVQADEALGRSRGVHGTPTLFVNGAQVDNPFDYASFKKQIEAALAQAG